MLTALAISVVTLVLGSRDARNRVVGQLKSVVTLKEQEIASWTSGLQLNLDIVLSEENVPHDLRTLTRTAVHRGTYRTAYSRVQQRFIWAAKRMGLFEELFFMDDEGTVLISTDPGHEGQRLGTQRLLRRGPEGHLPPAALVLAFPGQDDHRGQRSRHRPEARRIGVIAGRAT